MRSLILIGVVVLGLAVALLVMLRRPPRPVLPSPTVIADAHVADAARAHSIASIDAAGLDAAVAGEHEAVLAHLRESGAGVEPWDQQGLTLLRSIAHDGVEIDEAGCFIAGCGAELTFPSEADYQRRVDELAGSELYRAWTGGKRLTPPELHPDGRVTIALVLYRPD